MKRTFIFLYLMAAGFAAAQETATIDMEERRQSVVTLKQHLAMREERLAEVAAEIRERGEATDKKIGRIVDMLTNTKDSQSSKRRISEIKGEAIAGLKRMLDVYKRERNAIVQKIRSDKSAPSEALMKDMDAIDKLAEKRVGQIVDLVKSMPGGEDISKYEQDGSYEYNGVAYENSRISEEWRQNRRDKVESEKERGEAQVALKNAIADLERRRDTLKAQLAGGKLNAAEKELFEQELGHVSVLVDVRKSQLLAVAAPSASSENPASKGEADDLKRLFQDARKDIADDFGKTVRLYQSAAAEREKIHEVKENLAAREKWLQENDPEAKKSE
ncbi:MAG: hypothetical protein EOP83_00730 [Verrucomicrobiaceae bacterium]|nr:MAG: hypothetical protein EOP83_00730 [Verrucomicrobiaceae bacterium]